MCAQVILLTGPSGSGKTSLLRRVGAHRLRLDDFYRDGDEPGTFEPLGLRNAWSLPYHVRSVFARHELADLRGAFWPPRTPPETPLKSPPSPLKCKRPMKS